MSDHWKVLPLERDQDGAGGLMNWSLPELIEALGYDAAAPPYHYARACYLALHGGAGTAQHVRLAREVCAEVDLPVPPLALRGDQDGAYGYGYGHGHGDGDGYGDGYGSGSGYGYGDGYGDGDGDGYGDGYGSGSGDGDGDGYGYGKGKVWI